MITRELDRRAINIGRIGDIQRDCGHTGVCGDDLIEVATPTVGDSRLVVQLWKASTNPRPMPEPRALKKKALLESFMT